MGALKDHIVVQVTFERTLADFNLNAIPTVLIDSSAEVVGASPILRSAGPSVVAIEPEIHLSAGIVPETESKTAVCVHTEPVENDGDSELAALTLFTSSV